MKGRLTIMGEFYGKKIAAKEINPKTGEAWTIDDVPKLWKAKTLKWLEEHVNETPAEE